MELYSFESRYFVFFCEKYPQRETCFCFITKVLVKNKISEGVEYIFAPVILESLSPVWVSTDDHVCPIVDSKSCEFSLKWRWTSRVFTARMHIYDDIIGLFFRLFDSRLESQCMLYASHIFVESTSVIID